VALALLACGLAGAKAAEAQATGGFAVDTTAVHETARHHFRVATVVAGLDHPWSMAWLPTGELLVTERPGRLRVVRDGRLEATPVSGVPTVYREAGQGGFMDILPHPGFGQNRLLYLSYGKPNSDGTQGTTTVVRGRLEGNALVDLEEIFEADAWGSNNNHFSGRMVFDADGYLFISVGDRQVDPDLGFAHPAQDLSTHLGKIVRLHDDGRVPVDNPFVDRPGAHPEIWTYGNRNPQGFAVDPGTGALWITDHGPRGGDELNRVIRGGNYGWPVLTYGIHYDGRVITGETERVGMVTPHYVWVPSIGTSGLTLYRGDSFPWWRGNALAGGMVGEQLARIALGDGRALGEEKLLVGVLGRIRDVRTGPDGLVYLALEGLGRGALSPIVRLEPMESDIEPPPTGRFQGGTP
jgi:glucose/arabinose dehydrogenase